MSKLIRFIVFIILAVVLGIGAYFKYYVVYIRTGTIVEVREDTISVQGAGSHDPVHVLYFDRKSRFYNSKGGEITLSELKAGDHFKAKLFKKLYGGIVRARKYRTIKWLKILPE